MKNELLKGLTKEQIEKARKCKSNEELLALAKEEGVTLSDEQLEAVSGGFCSDTTVNSVCPKCGTKVSDEVYNDSTNTIYVKFKCPNCGHKWDEYFNK